MILWLLNSKEVPKSKQRNKSKPKKKPKSHTPTQRQVANTPVINIAVVAPETFWAKTKRKTKKFFSGVYFWLGVIITIITVFTFRENFHKWFTSEHDLYKEDRFIKGLLVPDEILNSQHTIDVIIGDFNFQRLTAEFESGVDMVSAVNMLQCPEDPNPVKVKFKIIKNRLYASLKIIDLQKEEFVGEMNYNQWTLFEDNLLDWGPDNDDKKLQVIDRAGNVAFSMEYQNPNTVLIRGYFINEKSIFVSSDSGLRCISKSTPNWKELSLSTIKNIKRIF